MNDELKCPECGSDYIVIARAHFDQWENCDDSRGRLVFIECSNEIESVYAHACGDCGELIPGTLWVEPR